MPRPPRRRRVPPTPWPSPGGGGRSSASTAAATERKRAVPQEEFPGHGPLGGASEAVRRSAARAAGGAARRGLDLLAQVVQGGVELLVLEVALDVRRGAVLALDDLHLVVVLGQVLALLAAQRHLLVRPHPPLVLVLA